MSNRMLGWGRSGRPRVVATPVGTGVVAAAAAFGLAVSAVSAAPTVAAATGPVTYSYAASSAVIANPGRGMFHYTETHARADGSGYVPLDPSAMTRWRTSEAVTLVYRIFYLERFAGRDDIDAGYLSQVRADLSAARTAGVKLVIRFAYAQDSSQDAPATRVVGHIRQLAPALNDNADVIAAMQAGFVGQWGEWYYSDNFVSDRQRPWTLTTADWQARGAVLNALLDNTIGSIFLQVRYPTIKQRLLADAPSARSARVGIHDDCFLASADDYGTFATSSDYAWLQQQTLTVPMGGETCQTSGARSQWPSASADLAAYHWSYLNADYHPDVLASWGGGLDEARRRLGYRLRLTQVAVPATAVAGGTFELKVGMANDGYAAPFQARPVRLVLKDAGGRFTTAVPIDVRTIGAGRTTTFTVRVTAPSRPGTYAVNLALPDPSSRLAGVPAYSVQLANSGTWNAARGTNDLGAQIRVTSP